MNSFVYENPTKLIFGENCIEILHKEIERFGNTVLFVYGSGSIKKNGIYDVVVEELEKGDISFIEHSGVQGNPRLSHAEVGVDKVRQNNIDCIIAVGGGSVIDEAKAIAFGSLYDGPLWDIYEKKAVVTEALPIISILTLPATASEMNGFSVLTNDKTLEKFVVRATPISNPKVSFCDPAYTSTLSLEQTAFAAADIISHATEGYFTTTESELNPQDEIIEGIVRSVIDSMKQIRKDPKDMKARASLMWSATLAWNGIAQAGISGMQLPCHALEMPLSGIYDIAHGAGLSILTPSWMRNVKDLHGERLCRFGERCLGVSRDVEEVANAMEELYITIGAPLKLKDVGVTNIDIEELIDNAYNSFVQRGIAGYSRERISDIYKAII